MAFYAANGRFHLDVCKSAVGQNNFKNSSRTQKTHTFCKLHRPRPWGAVLHVFSASQKQKTSCPTVRICGDRGGSRCSCTQLIGCRRGLFPVVGFMSRRQSKYLILAVTPTRPAHSKLCTTTYIHLHQCAGDKGYILLCAHTSIVPRYRVVALSNTLTSTSFPGNRYSTLSLFFITNY